jgi:Golgi nucleoside diphosphatase
LGSNTNQEIEASAQEVIIIAEPSVTPRQDMMQVDDETTEPEWATEIIQYLKNGLLPGDKMQS